jgi:hypothetical protein
VVAAHEPRRLGRRWSRWPCHHAGLARFSSIWPRTRARAASITVSIRPLRAEAVTGARPQRLQHPQHGLGVDLIDRQIADRRAIGRERHLPLGAIRGGFPRPLVRGDVVVGGLPEGGDRGPGLLASALFARRIGSREHAGALLRVLDARVGEAERRIGPERHSVSFAVRALISIDPVQRVVADDAEVEAAARHCSKAEQSRSRSSRDSWQPFAGFPGRFWGE